MAGVLNGTADPIPTACYMSNNPREQNYRVPAEWDKQSATWLAWPYDTITFPQRVSAVEKIYYQIIKALSEHELIKLLVTTEQVKEKVTEQLEANGVNITQIKFYVTDYADVWVRDYGPTFLLNQQGKPAWVKWRYNAYGNKFPDLLKDNLVFNNLTEQIKATLFTAPLVMEGGAIEPNGQGLVLTTEQCLLSPSRNPNLTRQQTEQLLKDYLGANKIIWLKQGLYNDHTDGHIDEVARFVNPTTVVLAWTDNINNPNYQNLRDNLNILQQQNTLSGEPLNIIKLPLPEVYYDNNQLAPASYANFYLANKTVLIPQFGQATDLTAAKIIADYFPKRTIIGLNCLDLLYGGGGLHCITQPEPA